MTASDPPLPGGAPTVAPLAGATDWLVRGSQPTPGTSRAAWWPAGLGAALPLLAFLLWGDVGLSLQDEGFLWYGAQRVLAGEIPQLDFQAYDVARYYGPAAWMKALGSDGILAFRTGHALVAAVCVLMATALLRADARLPAGWIAVVAVAFWLWLVPYYKLADSLAALVLVSGLTVMLRSAIPRHWLLFGGCLGFAGTLGINHGLYGALAGAMAVAILMHADRRQVTWRAIGALSLGCLLGYAPVVAFHLAVPGYSAAVFDGIRQLEEAGATNIALPLPRLDSLWIDADNTAGRRSLRQPMFALLFWASAAGLLGCAVRVVQGLRSNDGLQRPLFLASVLVAVPYAHYVLSRADIVHLAISILPLMLAAAAWPVSKGHLWQRASLVAMTAGAVLATPEHAGYPVWRGKALETVEVRGDRLRVESSDAARIRLVQRLVVEHAPAARSFYTAPYWPGAYALAGRRSPVWEIYALFPARPARQLQEIARLAAVDLGFALLTMDPVDRRPDLGFEHTHPLILHQLQRCLRDVDPPLAFPENVLILVPHDSSCSH